MACVLGRAVIPAPALLRPHMLSGIHIRPVPAGIRTVCGPRGHGCPAGFADDFPRAADRPLFLRGGMRTIPERIQRHACICGISAARLILCTGHEFIRCPALEGIPRAAGGYRRQCQRDIVGFDLTARRTTAAIGIIRNGVGCRSVFLPNGIESTTDIGVIPLAGLISWTGTGSTHSPPEKGISVSYRFYRRNQYFYIMSFSLRAGRTAATVCVV